MSFSGQKGEFDRFFNRLDRPVEESRPDRPVDPTGSGRHDRFPSLVHIVCIFYFFSFFFSLLLLGKIACIFSRVDQIQSFPSLKFLRKKNYGTNPEIQFR